MVQKWTTLRTWNHRILRQNAKIGGPKWCNGGAKMDPQMDPSETPYFRGAQKGPQGPPCGTPYIWVYGVEGSCPPNHIMWCTYTKWCTEGATIVTNHSPPRNVLQKGVAKWCTFGVAKWLHGSGITRASNMLQRVACMEHHIIALFTT